MRPPIFHLEYDNTRTMDLGGAADGRVARLCE